MAEEKLLTVREVAILLGISEKDVIDLAESGAIPAYKVGGVYLRFKKEQVLGYRKNNPRQVSQAVQGKIYTGWDRVSDFLYFNDFYVLIAVVVIALLVFIFQGY